MIFLSQVLVAHFVADWVLQSNWMALNKSKRWDALAWHVLVYGAGLFFLTLGMVYPGDLARWVGFNMAIHYFQDAFTSRMTSRLWFIKLLEPKSTTMKGVGWVWCKPDLEKRHWFFVAIGLDQMLHYLTLFWTAKWLLGV